VNRPRLLVALAALAIIATLLVIASFIETALRIRTGDALRAIQASNLAALELWLGQHRETIAGQAQRPAIAAAARNLLHRHYQSTDWNASSAASGSELKTLQQIRIDSAVGWLIIDTKGRIVAGSWPNLIGQSLPLATDNRNQITSHQTSLLRPFPLPISLDSETAHHRQPGGPMMAVLAPISDGPPVTGAIALLINPLDELAPLLASGRVGQTGETYLLDRHGILLTPSRFQGEPAGKARRRTGGHPLRPLQTEIRDPKGALTLMADQLTRGGRGENLLGYVGYRGTQVVGVWQWLSRDGLGIATEIDAEEAFGPARRLRRIAYAITTLLLAGGVVSLLLQRKASAAASASSGAKLGRYRLGELISEGAVGSVYRGRHPSLRRDVAIKVLSNEASTGPQTIARFEREVQLTAQLRHPNTIDIYDVGRGDDGSFYYVMEFVDGMTLQELVDQYGRQPPARVIHLLTQVCGSLSEAHQLGMIHRDIKPSNILLTAGPGLYDMIKVVDFGLVKQLDDDVAEETESGDLTSTEGITGTPMYMSPEAVRDAATTEPRSDLYSLGAVGYLLLTGRPLFEGDSSVDVCLNQLSDEPLRPSKRINQPLPEDLQNVLMSCLRKSPEQRPRSAADLADSLSQCQDAGHWTAAEAMQWWDAGAN